MSLLLIPFNISVIFLLKVEERKLRKMRNIPLGYCLRCLEK